jgi:hypothetical protein
MSRLSQRVETLERQTAQRRGWSRCPTCREWPSRHILTTEINADDIVIRQDRLEGPSTCTTCGWTATIHAIEIVEVRNWDTVGRHGRI